MSETKNMRCSACDVVAEGVVKSNGGKWVRCSGCGNEQPLDEAVRDAVAYRLHQGIQGVFAGAKNISLSGEAVSRPAFLIED